MKNGFLKSYSDSKNVKYSSINVAFCALIIAIVIILNAMLSVFSEKFHWQLDMTEEGIFTMSEKMEAAVEDIFEETDAKGMTASIEEESGEWILTINVPAAVADAACRAVTTARLGTPRITEEAFENPDGTPVDFTLDLLGNVREGNVIPGPIARLKEGVQRIVVWKR